MYHLPARRWNLLVKHPDPIRSAGVVAALRQQSSFEVFVYGVDRPDSAGPVIDAVITDYSSALRLTDPSERRSHGVQDDTRILVLTANNREVDIRRAIEAGVHGYLLTGCSLNELIDGAAAVAAGSRFMSVSVAQRMADSLTHTALTSREIEVLRHVSTGQPNKVVARHLSIELGTVKSHMSAIMTKLGATSRTQAVRIASSRGLVDDEALPESRQPHEYRSMELAMQYA